MECHFEVGLDPVLPSFAHVTGFRGKDAVEKKVPKNFSFLILEHRRLKIFILKKK